MVNVLIKTDKFNTGMIWIYGSSAQTPQSTIAIPTDHQINDALTGLSHKTARHFAIQQAAQITHKYASARQRFCTRAIKVPGLQPASIWSAPGLTSGDGFVIRGSGGWKGRYAGSDDKPQGAWHCPLKRKRLLVGKGKFTVSFDGAALYGAALIVIISVKFQILAVSRRA